MLFSADCISIRWIRVLPVLVAPITRKWLVASLNGGKVAGKEKWRLLLRRNFSLEILRREGERWPAQHEAADAVRVLGREQDPQEQCVAERPAERRG